MTVSLSVSTSSSTLNCSIRCTGHTGKVGAGMVALRNLIGQEWAAVSACGAGVQQPCNLSETYLFICTARMGLVILFQAALRVCSKNQN